MTKGTVVGARGEASTGDILNEGKVVGKFAEMKDGTKVNLRNFRDSEPNVNAVIDILNKESKAKKESFHFEYKYFDEN